MQSQKTRPVYASKNEFLKAWEELRQKQQKALKKPNTSPQRHNREKGAA